MTDQHQAHPARLTDSETGTAIGSATNSSSLSSPKTPGEASDV